MQKKQEALNKQLIFTPRTLDLAEFESLAAGAKDAGFTHIYISDLLERSDFRGEDKDSPWCEWSVILPSLFKFVTPQGLEEAFPAEFVKRQMEFMRAKHRIVKKLGLRAAFWGVEPHWLSERVYRKHPEWRGSRCDNSLRTTGMYFAPNVWHPEVLAAYREAVKLLVRECPLIDIIALISNDSGAGYPWTKRLYVNPNGPTGYLGRDMGDCVVNFLSTLREGARQAGADVHVFSDTYCVDDEIHLIKKSLKPGVGVIGRAPEPLTAECSLGSCGAWGGGPWLATPFVDKWPTPMSVIDGAAAVKTSKVRRFHTGGNTHDFFTAFKVAMSLPPVETEQQKMDALAKIAEELYGADVVDEVIDAWFTLDRAETMMAVMGVDTMGGPLMMRWLTRPLVAHQELLTDEERAYWEPFIYQSKASHPEVYLDYLNLCGYLVASDWGSAGRVCCAIDEVEATLKSAAGQFQAASDKASNKNANARLQHEAYRVLALRSLALTTRHYLQMGTLIYLRDEQAKQWRQRGEPMPSTNPPHPDLPKGSMGDTALFYMHRAMRWELDNTYELIELIKKSPVPLFYSRPQEWEGALVLGPNLLEGLQKKVDITLKYWRTAEQGFFRPTLGG